MKILFISESFGSSLYGVAQVIVHIIRHCSVASFEHRILAYSIDDSECENSMLRQIPVYNMGKRKSALSRMLRFHHRMYPVMKREMQDFRPDIVHIHGTMTFVQTMGILAAINNAIPVLISPHGMLEPWLWKQKGMLYYGLKRMYWATVLRPVLRRADYVHAITEQESETLKREFPGVPQIRISNAVDLNEYEPNQVTPDAERYLLFIGRLHPKKGVDLLIEAFKESELENFKLVIAGPDFDASYTAKLKEQVQALGLSEVVKFVGSVHGQQKSTLLQKAWCTVIPSYSDVVALVNLESAASFAPTITTTMTGLSDWQEGGGLLVEPELKPLTEAMMTACAWSENERMAKGKRARAFVEERYSWDVIGEQWVEAYKMIAESGKKKHES